MFHYVSLFIMIILLLLLSIHTHVEICKVVVTKLLETPSSQPRGQEDSSLLCTSTAAHRDPFRSLMYSQGPQGAVSPVAMLLVNGGI